MQIKNITVPSTTTGWIAPQLPNRCAGCGRCGHCGQPVPVSIHGAIWYYNPFATPSFSNSNL